MNRLFLLFAFFTLSGCEAHLVTKEQFFEKTSLPNQAPLESCVSAEILPVELSNEIQSNSIFWLPIIPTPWRAKEYLDKVRVAVVYRPGQTACEPNDLNLISGSSVHKPWMAFLFEPRSEIKRCIYEFELSSAKLDKEKSRVEFNIAACSVNARILQYEKNTVYENHFQPW